jgi:hypothetical protein
MTPFGGEASGRISTMANEEMRADQNRRRTPLNFDVNAFDFVDEARITMKYPHSTPLTDSAEEIAEYSISVG